MQPYEVALELPERGDATASFDATFDHHSRQWERGPVIVTLYNGVTDIEETLPLADLDESSRLMVEAEIERVLDADKPTEDESAREVEQARLEYLADQYRDSLFD